jgi:hypothetical protein
MRYVWLVALLGAGCSFDKGQTAPSDGGGPGSDAPDAYIPDGAVQCSVIDSMCVGGSVLRSCLTVGLPPVDETCPWGCLDLATPHCGKLQPVGGAVTPADLDNDPLLTGTTLTAATVDGNDGTITGGQRASGTGVNNGIDYNVQNGVAVFRFSTLTISGAIKLRGPRPIAFVVTGALTINALIDVQGDCMTKNAGPGGSAGGNAHSNGSGTGGGNAGTGSHNNATGGGGGGFGASGGGGGNGMSITGPSGGTTYGNLGMTLVGGSGGAGGGGGAGGVGGGGGGAFQIAANGTILFAATGGINAGGCGGKAGADGGGAGGSGGALLIEAPVVHLGTTAILAVNGGGGAGGNTGAGDGTAGLLSASQAPGGAKVNNASADGGPGGASGMVVGNNGGNDDNAGGGGGAVGWMRFETLGGSLLLDTGAVLSPNLSETNTSAVVNTATVQ